MTGTGSSLQVEVLRAGYGPGMVVHGLSFRVAVGERLGVRGPNGTAKTTLQNGAGRVLPVKSMGRDKPGVVERRAAQMLAIGRALMADPAVLLLDEPSQGAESVVEEVAAALQALPSRMTLVAGLTRGLLRAVSERVLRPRWAGWKGRTLTFLPGQPGVVADEEAGFDSGDLRGAVLLCSKTLLRRSRGWGRRHPESPDR